VATKSVACAYYAQKSGGDTQITTGIETYGKQTSWETPRKRWINRIDKDLNILGVREWKTLVQDRVVEGNHDASNNVQRVLNSSSR